MQCKKYFIDVGSSEKKFKESRGRENGDKKKKTSGSKSGVYTLHTRTHLFDKKMMTLERGRES